MVSTHKLVVLRPANGRTITITKHFDSLAAAEAGSANVYVGDTWTLSTVEGVEVSHGEGTKVKGAEAMANHDPSPEAERHAEEVKMHAEHVAEEKTMQQHAVETVAMAHAHRHEHDAHTTGATGPAA